jgi:flavorubredoxin
MAAKMKMNEHVQYIGSQDWDRRIFDSLIPLPEGTSYNSYVITGSHKTALIDTVDAKFEAEFMGKLKGIVKLDYVIINHVEQDHSGCAKMVLDKYPEAQILCSEKARDLIMTHLHIKEGSIRVVKDMEEISLGDRTLRFCYAPFVHWPETMLTFLVEDKMLFSCDMFGSHLANSEIYACKALDKYEEPCKRYYAEIMMPFAAPMKKNLEKVALLSPSIICPSHGPVWNEPKQVMDLYKKWAEGEPENLALIASVSMHGSTFAMVERLTNRLSEGGVHVARVDLVNPDLGKIAEYLVDAHTIVVCTPTILGGPHPAAASAVLLANALRPKTKLLAVMGSYGWGGKAAETLVGLLTNLSSAEVLPPVMIKGLPNEEQMQLVDQLAGQIIERHAKAYPAQMLSCSKN